MSLHILKEEVFGRVCLIKMYNFMEKEKRLEYGRKYMVGNFYVLKVNRVLRKSEVAELRNQMNIPMDIRKNLQRSQLPYIKVAAVSGIWSIEFCCNTAMYNMIDLWLAGDDEEQKTSLYHMFNMMFTDTTIVGDAQYMSDKAKAMKALMDRQKAPDVSEEDDAKILESVKADDEAKATIIDMAEQIKKGGGDEG